MQRASFQWVRSLPNLLIGVSYQGTNLSAPDERAVLAHRGGRRGAMPKVSKIRYSCLFSSLPGRPGILICRISRSKILHKSISVTQCVEPSPEHSPKTSETTRIKILRSVVYLLTHLRKRQ